jgi:hypothetical protein
MPFALEQYKPASGEWSSASWHRPLPGDAVNDRGPLIGAFLLPLGIVERDRGNRNE